MTPESLARTSTQSIDILMITHRRPHYTELSLQRLLDTCDDSMRVWIWHNGEDETTLRMSRSFASHPCVVRFHHSIANVGLREPTNWLWSGAKGEYVSKVDDDCLVSPGWVETLRSAHEANPHFGVVGSWRFFDEDFVPTVAERKIRRFGGGHRLMRNCWVQGSGYLMKRRCVEEQGLLAVGQNFTDYCVRLELRGFVNGWYFPFVQEEHLDDPRSPRSGLRSDEDLQKNLPLSAAMRGITTLTEWETQMRKSAQVLQSCSINPRNYVGLRGRARFFLRRIAGL